MDEYWEASRPKVAHTWKSTGLYAKAGTIVEIEVPAELVNKSLVTNFFIKLVNGCFQIKSF